MTLTLWQKRLVEAIVSTVPRRLLVGRGRRAGWTVALREVERILKWRGREPLTLWDGRTYDPRTGRIT